MDKFLEMFYYGTILLFGIYLSAAFLGIRINRRNSLILLAFSAVVGAVNAVSYVLSGIHFTEELYPLITHLSLALFFVLFYKYRVLPAVIAVFTAYLSCQVSNWMGMLVQCVTEDERVYYCVRIITTVVVFIVLIRYVAAAVAQLLQKSAKDVMIFGLIPIAYYVYDYAVTVYTELLYSGIKVITELLACMLYIFYVVFVLVYFKQYEEKQETQQRSRLMEMQRAQSEKEVDRMKRSEYLVTIMRHDMRHFLNDISSLIKNGEYDRAQTYIHEIIENVDATVEKKYCSNKIVNLILSSYETMIQEGNIDFQYSVELPQELGYSDSDISAILSNALENAVHAVSLLEQGRRKIVLDMHMNNDKLLISIKNTYGRKPKLVDGMPQTKESGHGFGTQSIRYMTEKLKGNCQFVTDEQYFILRVVL